MSSFLLNKTTLVEKHMLPICRWPISFWKQASCFADIAGFTAWSSAVREPFQVFMLLEKIYNEFDMIAKDMGIFKVETVGDCYVAAAGLPEYRYDHTQAMASFAEACLKSFNSQAQQLEVLLGPDTSDLAMRIGIHSGPVTAGVLRGERARFQLFGDTMNTTARIESTCKPGHVHSSLATARLLTQVGWGNRLTRRADRIHAKGLGSIETYWLIVDAQGSKASRTEASRAEKISTSLS